MKGKTLSLMGILAAAIGAVIIICFKSITMHGVVIAGGLLFVVAGLANIVVFGQKSSNETSVGRVLNQIGNTAAIILGICMLVFQSTFEPLITYMFGLLVAVCALWQFFVLAIGVRPHQLPGWTYLFPLLLTSGAVFIFLNIHALQHVIMLTTGISLCVLALGCILEGSMLGVVKRKVARQEAQTVSETPVEAKETAKKEASESESESNS